MTFRLPDPEELSAQQRRVLDLPLDESHLVTGPPGSGKTVMAVYRANMLHKTHQQDTLLLMYQQLLKRYAADAISDSELRSQVLTYWSWFNAWFRRTYKQRAPMLSKWDFDWPACFEVIGGNRPPARLRPHLLIDEGQDMPEQFYLVMRAVASTVTVFADENQRIMEQQSKVEEIRRALGITSVAQLDRNFRNTKSIAAVAAHFYTGAGDPPVEVVGSAEEGDKPALIHDGTMVDAIDRIVRFENSHSDQNIGVFLPRQKQVTQFYNRLDAKTKNKVTAYFNGQDERFRPIDFAKPGIKLVCWPSAKGLEFDSVFVPELQDVRAEADSTDLRMKLYVLSSRAQRALHFMYSGQGEPAILSALPMELLDDWRS